MVAAWSQHSTAGVRLCDAWLSPGGCAETLPPHSSIKTMLVCKPCKPSEKAGSSSSRAAGSLALITSSDLLIQSMHSFCSAICFSNPICSDLTCLFPVQRMCLFQCEKTATAKCGAGCAEASPAARLFEHMLAKASTK